MLEREPAATGAGDAAPPPHGGLLAVDLGLRIGFARFSPDLRLVRYGSRHFGTRTQLRGGIRAMLSESADVSMVALEGGGDVALPWLSELRGRGLGVLQTDAGRWRERLLLPREQRPGRDAKKPADALARAIIEEFGGSRPTSLRHDAAEAILVGVWALLELGWLSTMPRSLRR